MKTDPTFESPEDKNLVDFVIHHASILLSEIGEFFPYAIVLDKLNTIHPYLLEPEEGIDDVDINVFRKTLINLLDADVLSGSVVEYVVATNVRARKPNETIIIDAIEIVFSNKNGIKPSYYAEYEIRDGGVIFLDFFTVSA